MSHSDEMQHALELAHRCSHGGRLPTRLVSLADLVEAHGEALRSKVETILLQEGHLPRIARRAAQAAPSNVLGAERIISAMERLVGRELAFAYLEEEGYVRHLLDRAESFARKGQSAKTQTLLIHLSMQYGDSRLDVRDRLHFFKRQRILAEHDQLLEPTLA